MQLRSKIELDGADWRALAVRRSILRRIMILAHTMSEQAEMYHSKKQWHHNLQLIQAELDKLVAE